MAVASPNFYHPYILYHTEKNKMAEKEEMRKCSGCSNMIAKKSTYKTCETCRKRGVRNRMKAKKEQKKCIAKKKGGSPCGYKVSPKCDNLYCEKHMNQWQLHGKQNKFRLCQGRAQCYPDDPEKKNLKKLLPIDYPYAHCENCRQRGREKDQERRDERYQMNEESTSKQYCLKCGREILLEEVIITKRNEVSPYCQLCFKTRQEVESNRERDAEQMRARYKEYEQRPEVKKMRTKWRQENPDKTYDYYEKYREKQLKDNPEEYRKKNAERQAEYRKKHPENRKISTKRYQTIINDKYKIYQNYAEEKGYDFDIEVDDFKKIITSNCYYCGCKNKKCLNGIDRLNNDFGYINDNMVSACKTCNNMKNTLNLETFVLMCAHIATCSRFYKTKLFPQVFNNYRSASYTTYKSRAVKKKLAFELTEDDFNKYCKNDPCYICKRLPSDKHLNGIDRLNNKLGYTINNCRACCGDCNYLKKDLTLDDLLFRCAFIAHQQKNELDELLENWTPSKFGEKNLNKLSKEEIIELRKKRKQNKFAKTLASKSFEARQARMKEIRKIIDGNSTDDDIVEV